MTPQKYGKSPGKLFAYVSVGEVLPVVVRQRCAHHAISVKTVLQSKVVDVSSKAWRDNFLDKVIEPYGRRIPRLFFLNTGFISIGAKREAWSDMEKGLAEIILQCQTHPEVN